MRRPALPLPPRKTKPLAELAQAVDGPAPEFVDPPAPDGDTEVDWGALPRWMRGQPGHGPPEEQDAQAARGAAQDDSSTWLPE